MENIITHSLLLLYELSSLIEDCPSFLFDDCSSFLCFDLVCFTLFPYSLLIRLILAYAELI